MTVRTIRKSHLGTRTNGTPIKKCAMQNYSRDQAQLTKGCTMLSRIVAIALALAISAVARADEFPTRIVTIVSPYQAGGTSDIIARILAQKLSERWGKNVIIENRPGANGGIGVTAVTHATPDGHTLLAVASSALTINPIFYPKLPYDVDRDLAPITRTAWSPMFWWSIHPLR